MLDSVLRTDSATRAHEQQLRELVRAIAAFERDVLQVVVRPVRDPFGDPRPALLGEEADGAVVELTRLGWRNPLGRVRANVQRVRWQLSGEQWQRRYWNVLDQAQDSQPQVQQVLGGVTRMRLRYLDGAGSWYGSWPPPGTRGDDALEELPQALELTLEHRHYGELRRLLRLPDVLPEQLQQAAQADQENQGGQGAEPESAAGSVVESAQ
jgi:general secretion pathway protein J